MLNFLRKFKRVEQAPIHRETLDFFYDPDKPMRKLLEPYDYYWSSQTATDEQRLKALHELEKALGLDVRPIADDEGAIARVSQYMIDYIHEQDECTFKRYSFPQSGWHLCLVEICWRYAFKFSGGDDALIILYHELRDYLSGRFYDNGFLELVLAIAFYRFERP